MINEGKVAIELSDEAKTKIERCREYLDQKLKESNHPIYGINTGFGSLYNKHIPHGSSRNFRRIWLSPTLAVLARKFPKKL